MCLTPADWISLGGAVATAIGVFVVWRQTQKLTQQLTLQNYSDYEAGVRSFLLPSRGFGIMKISGSRLRLGNVARSRDTLI